jgi:hypothetical protein
MTIRKMKLVWKYRKPLWKYRKLVARRREIAGAAIAGAAAIAGFVMFKRANNRSRDREGADALKSATI